MLPKREEEPAPKTYKQRHPPSTNKKYTHFIKPMLAKLHEGAFDNEDWIFEIKWDGYRAVAEVDKGNVRLYSRNGLSFETDYPIVYEALKKIKKQGLVLDGEIVALDENGKPSFQLLQQYDSSTPLCYYVFDCLKVNGISIEDKPLLERKAILQKLLPESNIISYCDHVAARGKDFFKAVKTSGLEGMIAKRADSTYHEGTRSSSWLKVKHILTEEAVIAGYTAPRGGRKLFGALVLGVYKNGKLVYIGHTGTGFDDKTLRQVYDRLQPLRTDTSPFGVRVPVNSAVTWVVPRLVCNIKYTEVTEGGNRRHPVFMGLRVDKEAQDVHEEVKDGGPIQAHKTKNMRTATKNKAEPVKDIAISDKEQTIGGRTLIFTNTDKVFWPKEGYTKGDVINYYNTIYPYMGKYLKDRPQSLLRMPNGILSPGFFHKDAGDNAPEWVDTYKMFSESADKEINYIVCNEKATLLYLANLGCIEINPWCSRVTRPDHPDYLVLDIDPSEKNTFGQVIETANVIKEILDRAGADSYPKTSGATGLHVYVPLGAKYTYEQAKDFAHLVAVMAHEQLPKFTSLERSLSKRGKNQIYIDFLQNRRGQTLASPYSLRPKPGATVSTPLDWSEVKDGLLPSDHTIENILTRIKKKGDIFAAVLKKGIDMKKCLKALGG
ncbi:hypothetical protein GCM10023093_06440 [Nemorincola caseinilytica]|uniref:DNA ligase (ATP) n=1 Tax=Nemorincola caseinilytica TaxID=2054315 RepID=A0ABP8N767_9BACT